MDILTTINRRIGQLLGKTGGTVAALTRGRIRSHGVEVDTSSPLIANETRAGLFWGYYEGSERRAALAYLRADLPIIEVGASIGFLSALIARRVGARYQVAVEANPALIPILKETLRINRATQVKVVPAAIAYDGERASFSPVSDTASGRLATASDDAKITVATTSLAVLLEDAPPGPFALVCDIEGAEYELFLREPESVRTRCQLALMELHEITRAGRHYSRGELATWLSAQWRMKVLFNDGKVWVFGR